MLTNVSYQEKLLQKYTHLPWFTFPAIEYLVQLDLKDKTVFEWGSGDSTLFFFERCKKIISVEHNPEYYAKCKAECDDVEIYLQNTDHFVEKINDFNMRFDVIVIDSERREDCCQKAVEFLNVGGLIIFDNSNWHGGCCKFLRAVGLIQVDFHGMGPFNDYAWTTSLFFTRNSNFQPLLGQQPQCPIFGDLIVGAKDVG